MTLYRIEEGRKATHICIEAEIVNHTDWAALHIIHTKAEAIKTAVWYMADVDTVYTAKGYRYTREVMSDCYICYHTAEGWTYLSEGEPVKMSDLRRADAIMAGGADDEMAWAADPERVTVYVMDEDQLRVDIDVNELDDDCEAVNVAELDERTDDELSIIRIQPTAQTATEVTVRCADYARRTWHDVAPALLALIANPANDGRWTDADMVKDILHEAYIELREIACNAADVDMAGEWWTDPRTLAAIGSTEKAQEPAEAPAQATGDNTDKPTFCTSTGAEKPVEAVTVTAYTATALYETGAG